MPNPPLPKARILAFVSSLRRVRSVRMIPEYRENNERSMNFRYYR
jgi:hypothetical protein